MKVKDRSFRQPMGAGQIKIAEVARAAVDGFQPTICIVYLYGSRATGTDNEESDFDFAVAADRPLSFGERRGLASRFVEGIEESSSSVDVDVVDLRAIPLTLAAQILEYGVVLIGEAHPERGFLETRLMSQYALLNEERHEVIEAIVARGSVFART